MMLASVKLILVNAEGFAANGNSNIDTLEGNISELRDYQVECVAYSRLKSEEISSIAEQLGIILYEAIGTNGDFYFKMREEYSLTDDQIAVIAMSDDDIPFLTRVKFSAAIQGAPMKVKAESYFPTYSTGGGAVSEIAELILKAKKYHNGWSE